MSYAVDQGNKEKVISLSAEMLEVAAKAQEKHGLAVFEMVVGALLAAKGMIDLTLADFPSRDIHLQCVASAEKASQMISDITSFIFSLKCED